MSETPSTSYSVTQPHTSESEQSLSARPFNVTDPVVAKRICFYKSGDPQFNGVKMVVNNRSFKSFDALLDNLSKRVPLPFGVRTITTPRGIHGITNLEDLEDGKSYICSQQKKIKPINLEKASRKPLPWQISRPVSARRKAVQLAREGEDGVFLRGGNVQISTPKKLLVFKNGDVRIRRTIVLGKKNTQNFEAFLDNISELMQYPVVKLYTTDGRKIPNLQALILCSGAVVAAGREPFRPGNYDPHRYSLPGRLPGASNRIYPKTNAKSEGRKNSSSRSQIFSTSSYKGYSNENDSASSFVPDNDIGLAENNSHAGEDLFIVPPEDDIEKSVHLNQDGSMTVEMRVRFQIKEEETIKWTTTVSRAGFSTDTNVKAGTPTVITENPSSELNILSCKNLEDFNSAEDHDADQQICEEENNKDSLCGLQACNYDRRQKPSTDIEPNDKSTKPHFYRPPTPGPRRLRQKKALVESVTMVSDTNVQKKMIGQFSYSEETDTGETKSEYCLVTHSSNKTSNVNNLKLRKGSSNQVQKQSLEDEVEEEMLNKGPQQTPVERPAELPENDSLLQKSSVKKGSHNCITSDCGVDTSHAESSPRDSHASEEILCHHNSTTERQLNHSTWSQSTREETMSSQKSLHFSQDPIHPSPDEIVCRCAKDPTTPESSITANNSHVECINTQFSDESQAISSSSKKKKKKKRKSSSDITCSQYRVEGTVENGIRACDIHDTIAATPHLPSQITFHKNELPLLVHNSNGSYKSLDAQDDRCSQVPLNQQPNESNLMQNLDSQLPKVRLKSGKTLNSLPSQEDGLLSKDYSKNEIEHFNEGTPDSTNIIKQTQFGITPLKPLKETRRGRKEEKGKGKPHKSSVKLKKVKKNKEMECSPGSQARVLEESCTLDPFRKTNEIAEYSLENYVLNWLLNTFPRAPINSNDKKTHLSSDTSYPDKETQLEEKNEYLIGKSNISEGILSSSTLNHLNEIGVREESFQHFHERHIGCLTVADASIIDETKSDIQYSAKPSMYDIVPANDQKKASLGSNSQCLKGDYRCPSETATHIDPKAIDNIFRTIMQKDCMSGLLLHQLKSAVLNVEKKHSDSVEKSGCLPDISPSLLGSSSELFLAWLLVQNFKESLSSMNDDSMGQATCKFSEIVALQQYLKQITVKEEVKDLKKDVSDVKECTGNQLVFSGMQTETREPTYCQENTCPVDAGNTSDCEKQEKQNAALNSNDRSDSEEITDANELTDESGSSRKSQDSSGILNNNSNLGHLDHHNALQAQNCVNAHQYNNCGLTSNEELPEDNEDASVQELQDRNTDTSFNNEESELTEQPRSTTYSLTSNDKDHVFDIETSELEDKDVNSIEEHTESPQKEEHSSEHLSLTAENVKKSGSKENSIQECLEESATCEEPSEPAPSRLSFCYESKQSPVDASVEEPISRVKLMVKELECGSYSNSSLEFKRCFKSPALSDLPDYPPDSERSEYNCIPSSDLTNASTEETIYEKEYNTGYVKRAIERLYGKAEVPFKPISKLGPPYMSQMQNDAEEPSHFVMEEASALCQARNSGSDEKTSSLTSCENPEEINTSSNVWENENDTWPAPQFSFNEEESCYDEEYSMPSPNQYCLSKAHSDEDEGVLIDKGKWILKENHLIRRSPPENVGMYGNIDTTSVETMVDNHNDDIPYSHFGNLDRQPPLKEISSSEIEDLAKPFDNGCNYFNMPHNSESEPFPDELSIKSKHSQYGSTLPAEVTRKECITPTQPCTEVKTHSPSFTSIEFRLPDNKVHPLEQPSHEKAHVTQPTSNTHSNRIRQEDQDSLDKLHAICGQHCPILMAIVKPTNEEVRRCAYQKASDIENQLDLHFLMNTLNLRWQGKGVNTLDNKYADLKKNCINAIANNIFNRLHDENILEFMNENSLGLLMSTVLKENKSLKKLYAREKMDLVAEELNNSENYATEEVFKETAIDQDRYLSVSQSSGSNVSHQAEEKLPLLSTGVTEGCESETFYSCETFSYNIDQSTSVKLENENTVDVTEETHPYIVEEESSHDNSNF